MAKPIRPFFRFCIRCGKKYTPLGRYSKICPTCCLKSRTDYQKKLKIKWKRKKKNQICKGC